MRCVQCLQKFDAPSPFSNTIFCQDCEFEKNIQETKPSKTTEIKGIKGKTMIDLKIKITGIGCWDDAVPLEFSFEEAKKLYGELGKVFENRATWFAPNGCDNQIVSVFNSTPVEDKWENGVK